MVDDASGDGSAGGEQATKLAAIPSQLPPAVLRFYLSWLPALIVLFGVAVRARQYGFRRSLWADEAAIALNIVGRSYRELLRPLDFAQAAPIGWLWAERAAVDLLGGSEHALRLVPLLAGIATLLGLWWAARRLLPAWLVPVALALGAVAPYLLRYSNEAKQYESDAAIGLALLVASLALLDDRAGWRPMLAWAGLGAVAVWCSHPSVMLLAGYSAAIGGWQLLRRRWAALARLAAASLAWGSSFLVVYLVSLRPVGRSRALSSYWRNGFAPRPFDAQTATQWLGGRWAELVRGPLGLSPRLVVTIVLLLGCAALLRRRRAEAVVLLGPVPVFVGAAAVHAYPLQGRLLLVLVPTALLVAAAAPDWYRGRPAPATMLARGLGLVLIGVTLVAPADDAVSLARHPQTVNELRPVLEGIKARRQAGDLIWLHQASPAAFNYYAPALGLRRDATVGFVRAKAPCHDRATIRRVSGGGRVWLVFGHHLSGAPPNERAIFLSRMELAGAQVESVSAPGAAAHLYDLTRRPGDPTGASVLPSDHKCLKVAKYRP